MKSTTTASFTSPRISGENNMNGGMRYHLVKTEHTGVLAEVKLISGFIYSMTECNESVSDGRPLTDPFTTDLRQRQRQANH